MMYRECPFCGLNLDPGERCDCQNEERGRSAATETTSHKSYRIQSISPPPKSQAATGIKKSMRGATI